MQPPKIWASRRHFSECGGSLVESRCRCRLGLPLLLHQVLLPPTKLRTTGLNAGVSFCIPSPGSSLVSSLTILLWHLLLPGLGDCSCTPSDPYKLLLKSSSWLVTPPVYAPSQAPLFSITSETNFLSYKGPRNFIPPPLVSYLGTRLFPVPSPLLVCRFSDHLSPAASGTRAFVSDTGCLVRGVVVLIRLLLTSHLKKKE